MTLEDAIRRSAADRELWDVLRRPAPAGGQAVWYAYVATWSPDGRYVAIQVKDDADGLFCWDTALHRVASFPLAHSSAYKVGFPAAHRVCCRLETTFYKFSRWPKTVDRDLGQLAWLDPQTAGCIAV